MPSADKPNWRYECYYFGSSGWPSEAIWRVADDRHELWIGYPVLFESVEDARAEWEKRRNDLTVDASVEEDTRRSGRQRWSLGWWQRYPEKKDELYYYSRDQETGAPTELQPDKTGVPLD